MFLVHGEPESAAKLAVTRRNPLYGAVFLIAFFIVVAVLYFWLAAPFIGIMQVLVYAGAIMVLFLFVIMMLNLGGEAITQERQWLKPRMWIGPGILSAILLALLVPVVFHGESQLATIAPVEPKQVGIVLFGPYLVAVQLAAMLLLAGLVGASHLRRREYQMEMKEDRP